MSKVATPSTLDLIVTAYKKFKAHIYSDYNNLFIRSSLAEFESSKDFKTKLATLATELDKVKSGNESEFIESLIKEISYLILPKNIEGKKVKRDSPMVITNDQTLSEYKLEKAMFVINCPIELHILNVLWVMKVGKFLDDKIESKFSFGNRLYKGELDEHTDNLRKLFIPYFENYRMWRDSGINMAKHLHANKTDAVILTLDIKNYYYSANFDLGVIERDFPLNGHLYLNRILSKMHEKFRTILGTQNKLIPIGLLSSGIIANYLLSETDQEMCRQLKPAYYGRYVDDFIIVLANTSIKIDQDPEQFLNENLKNYPIFKASKNSELKLDNKYGDFIIQYSKVRLINICSDHPTSVIDEFEKNIKKTSSEAKLLVEEADMLSNFDSESSKISYSDSIHKLRSVDAFNIDKLGASTYLTNLIEATKITHKVGPDDAIKFKASVTSYFRGAQGIASYSLWEKVITFYTINNLHDDLFLFVKSLVTEIDKLAISSDFKLPFSTTSFQMDISKIRNSLLIWLIECLALSLALNPERRKSYLESLDRFRSGDADFESGLMKQIAAWLMSPENLRIKLQSYRESNLLRHKYVTIPLINYCKQDESVSYTDTYFNSGVINYDLDNDHKVEFSPRYISFHEIQLFYYFQFLNTSDNKNDIEVNTLVKEYLRINLLKSKDNEITEKFPTSQLPKPGEEWGKCEIKCATKNFTDKIKVAIVNLKISESDAADAILGYPNLHYNRLSDLNNILNLASRERVNLILLPECAVPIQWVDYLARYAQKHQIGIITGIEHVKIDQTKVANFVCHILPFTSEKHNNVCITFRNKEDFSPEEQSWLRANKKSEYTKLRTHFLYSWAGLHFATFNCFEATSLKKRANVVGKIDMLALVENNKDTEYFSNIVESSARDIHCVVSQVNNSQYGDSRVCLPARSYQRDQLRIRGGKNNTILVEEIDISGLRLYQMMGEHSIIYNKGCEKYKPLPPNYIMSESRVLKKVSFKPD